MAETRWFHPRGHLARDGWQTVVDGATDGWEHTGLRVVELSGGSVEVEAGVEKLVVPLAGSFRVEAGGSVYELAGRASVFDGPTDVLYVSTAEAATISGRGRVAVATSPTAAAHPTRHLAAADTPVELRGSGASSRQVHNFGTPQALDAARFIVCEVITPSENWSSYPPHKHDEHEPGHESRLEEIYYFESAPTRSGGRAESADAAFGMFSTYSSPAGEIDINARVQTGDVALVPYGYHGPAVAAPGYDLYYLNVMAGPDPERVWHISDDPAHAWVRDTWEGQPFDERLPYESTKG
ncbi:5-deoxy-glucuronate isomerase [Microbacterium excoecariae]|uniref:5-deoxy-glucuronate isomerase n=1 Tax=Microbacterium excoecariae TaxID=2715210 RepID=UPI0014075EFF|nr:5-deoxy-glucuronate isomerase [Microbacterium excoecariae]NHI16275.1 5-deoxy-glucuronate isomerase [Microbacterium excoecariae]